MNEHHAYRPLRQEPYLARALMGLRDANSLKLRRKLGLEQCLVLACYHTCGMTWEVSQFHNETCES